MYISLHIADCHVWLSEVKLYTLYLFTFVACLAVTARQRGKFQQVVCFWGCCVSTVHALQFRLFVTFVAKVCCVSFSTCRDIQAMLRCSKSSTGTNFDSQNSFTLK